MDVELLPHSYLNDRYRSLGITKEVDIHNFQPVAFTGYGISTVFSLKKVIDKSTPTFAPKSSMRLEDYEQLDSAGNTYLHDSYQNFYRRKNQLNYFLPDRKHQEYQQKSGYGKVVVANEKGERVYNGDEHTQLLTDRLGYLPIKSSSSYIVDKIRNVRVPLDQLWIFFGHIEGDREILDNIKQIIPIENTSTLLRHVTISNDLKVVYSDLDEKGAPLWYNITSQCVPTYNELGVATNLDDNMLFPYDTLFTSLKPGQRILVHCRLEESIGINNAKWMPSVMRYKFATERNLAISSQNQTSYETNVDQRNYLTRASDELLSKVFLNEPETIILTLESVGKLDALTCLERALTVTKSWLYSFQNSILDLSRFYNTKRNLINSYIAENLDVKVDTYLFPELILQVNNCNGAYLPLIADSLLRSLVERVRKGLANEDSPQLEHINRLYEILEHNRLLESQRGWRASEFYKEDQEQIKALKPEEEAVVNQLKGYISSKESEVKKITRAGQSLEAIRRALQELKLFGPSFEDQYLASIESEPMTNKVDRLANLVTNTKIASRVRHPLRPESYLTLKYPQELLDTVNMNTVRKYFYEGQFGDGTDQDLLNYYKILALTLEMFGDLYQKVDQLTFQVRRKFLEKAPPQPAYFKSRFDFEYRQMLRQNIITQYQEGTNYYMPYVAEQLHSGTPVRGQRKLFLTEVFFLSKFVTPETEQDYIVYYAGAADGSHQTVISKMFPGLKFVLFDPNFTKIREEYNEGKQRGNIFSLDHSQDGPGVKFYDQKYYGKVTNPKLDTRNIDFNDDNQYHIFPCYFTEGICQDLAKLAGDRKMLFISDLRVIPERRAGVDSVTFNVLTQQQVYDDNYLQYAIVNTLNQSGYLDGGMVKFRFPYKETVSQIQLKKLAENHRTQEMKVEETYLTPNQFYKGEVYIQPYAPGSTTESRLIVNRATLQGRHSLETYDDVRYEEFFSYINNVVRRSMKFYTPELTFNYHRQYSLANKYDHLLELLILNSYVVNYHREEIDSGARDPLELVWTQLQEIESNPTMSRINWKSTL